MDPIPEEGEIRKTDLWTRIGITRDIVEGFKQDLQNQKDHLTAVSYDELKHALDQASEAFQKVKESSRQDHLNIQQKTLDEFKATENRLENLLNSHVKEMEKRFNESLSDFPRLVNHYAAEMFADIKLKVDKQEEQNENFQISHNKSFEKYQTDTHVKVGLLDEKLSKVLGTLRTFMKSLID